MTANQSAIIRLQNLSKTYGKGETAVHALNNINLEIMPGEIFGIIGLSGAGKSTLVRCINYLERPTSGEVFVNGLELGELSQQGLNEARHSIGMIFQQFNLLLSKHLRRRLANAHWSCWSWLAFPTKQTLIPPSFPAAKNNGWPSPAPWPPTHRCYSATRQPPRLILPALARCWIC